MYVPYDTIYFFFFFNDTATTEIYTLSLHDALPISVDDAGGQPVRLQRLRLRNNSSRRRKLTVDRKSTRLNSSHGYISYAVFCLKKKKKNYRLIIPYHHKALLHITNNN